MSNIVTLFKICGALVLAYVLVVIINPRLFVDNSPVINKQFIASFREAPSYISVQFSALAYLFHNKNKAVLDEVSTIQKEVGGTEVELTSDEKAQLVNASGSKTNPAPNAVFNYVSQGVAASEIDTQGHVVLRMDASTQQNMEYRRFTRSDGTTLDVLILK